MATFLFVLVLILPLRFSNDTIRDNEGNNHIYAPTDTAIIRFSHPFCDQLIIHSPDSEFFVQVTLYLLEQTPTLRRDSKATFYREPRLTNDYEYWRMFLYPGSRVGYSACSIDSREPPVTFYLVKGNSNYETWRMGHSKGHVYREEIAAACEANANATFTFEVKSEDNYYFIFDSGAAALESVTGVTFDFERTLYDISMNSTILSECSVFLNDSTSCGVSIPHTSKPVALLELVSLVRDPMEWDAYIRVSVNCSARVWLYTVIAISAFVFMGLLAFSAILTYLCFCNKTSGETSVREDSHLISEKPQNTPYEAPPPYKPQ